MLKEKMVERGYNRKLVDKEYRNMRKVPREQALQRVKKQTREDGINFVTTYSSYLPNVKKVLSENFHHLQREGLQDIIMEPPRLSLWRGRNLGDLIINAKPKQHLEPGSGPCGKCVLCVSMRHTTSFVGEGPKVYKVQENFTCESIGMVYGMHCERCEKVVYVGKSQNSLRERFYAHRHDFSIEDENKPVAHFLGDGHSWQDLKVVGIEQVRGGDDVLRVVRERFWIRKLQTLEEENRRW